jgi:hypothetical protein
MRSLTAASFFILFFGGLLPVAAQSLPPGDTPPPTAADRLVAADGADWPDAHYLIVRDDSLNEVDERGVTTVHSEILYKVLDEEGCRELAVLRWNYDPQSKAIQLDEVNVLRGDETIPVDVGAAFDLPAPQAAIYWSDRIILLQLPRLEPGDGIEVKVSSKGFTYALLADQGEAAGGAEDDSRFIPPMPGEYFDVVLFAADVPILEKHYELHLAGGKRLHSEIYNGALYASTSYEGDTNIYRWWGRGLAPLPDENSQPAASDFAPKVVMATVESWEAKSRWFFDINNGQFDSTPEIDAKVNEVLAAAGVNDGSDAEKAEALVHWVAQNIRYSGQTMGEGEGFTLHPASMIFEQRSGVCKDIAGMLVTMLRAADIPANPAMTMAGSRIEEVPADQFNHCVVARQEGDAWVMYDPTWVPYNNDIWSKLETEQHYLVGSPEGETLSRIQYSPPQESPLVARHRARLESDGSLVGTIRLEGGGASDGRLRRLVYSTPARRLEARFAGLLAVFSEAISIRELRFHPVDDFSSDMWIEIDYRAEDAALPVDGGLELPSPGLRLLASDRSLFGAAAGSWPEERTTDLFLYMTQQVRLDEQIELPAGYGLAHAPEEAAVDETYAAFTAAAKVVDGVLRITAEAEVRRRQIPPAGYEGFAAAMAAASEWRAAVIRVAPAGGVS